MVWWRNAVIAAMLLVFLMGVHAQQQSDIGIAVVSGSVVVEKVVDDDDSIEFVDLFVGDEENVTQYRFTNVIEGQTLNVPYSTTYTIYYNFMDSDGQVVNVGYFIYIQNPKPPGNPGGGGTQPRVVLSHNVHPRRAEDNRNYYVDYTLDLNKELSISGVILRWGIGEGSGLSRTASFAFDPAAKKWKAAVGPFVNKVILNAQARITESSGKINHYSIGNKGFQLLVSEEAACNGQGSIVVNTSQQYPAESYGEINLEENAESAPDIYSQPLKLLLQGTNFTDFSFLKIVNVDGTITATEVVDNDNSIQRVDIFVIQGTSTSQYTYTNVVNNATFPINIPEGAMAYYNYMDFDGSVVNISFNNIISDGSIIIPPQPRPSRFRSFSYLGIPNNDYTSFTVNLSVRTNDVNYVIERVVFEYREDGTRVMTPVELQRSGNEWIGTIGPFDNALWIRSQVRMYDNQGGVGLTQFYMYWHDIVPPDQVYCIEICGNRIDDDQDGVIDEGCVLLPDHLFTSTENVPHFIVIDTPIRVPVTIKNAGVADSEAFEVALLMNDELIETMLVETLKVDEYKDLEFSVDDSNRFPGNNKLKISIDNLNVIPELNELNNIFEKDVEVGFNGLIVILNNNKKDILADEREMKVIDRFGEAVEGAKVVVSFPSGEEMESNSASDGIVRLQLTEPGNYLVSAEKVGYTSYSGAFNVRAIKVSGIGDVLSVGETIDFTVETEDNKPVPDAKIEIEYPTGEKSEIALNELGLGRIRPTIAGGHKIIVTRNGVKVFESGFIATGFVESLFIGTGSLGELLFGSIIRNPLLFLLLLVICLIAAAFAYNRSKLLFVQRAKSTREKQIEIAVRIGIAVLFFVLPFQINTFFGLQAAISSVIIEIASVLIADYYIKQARRKKAIGVK